MEWQESYNVGVAVVDNAHRKLFSIVKRLTEITSDKDRGKNKRACMEGIKYFKSYTLEHFAQEEEYMRSIAYSGYPMHRKTHEQLKNVTIPALEEELSREDYSEEAVSHFIGTCLAWLTVHIMVEDQAITGRVASRVRHHEEEEDKILRLANIISEVTEETFDFEAALASKYYSGGGMEDPVCFVLTYAKGAAGDAAGDAGEKQVLMAFEKAFVFFAAGGMMGVQFTELNGIVINTMEQLVQANVRRAGIRMGETAYMGSPLRCHMPSMEELEEIYQKNPPQYSLLFETDQGRFSFAL